jgi:hypothetical protein
MLLRIIVIGGIAIGLMIAIKQGAIMRGIGLLSNCEIVQTPQGEAGEWRACTEGKLDGRRDLSDMCDPMGVRGKHEYWDCPYNVTF